MSDQEALPPSAVVVVAGAVVVAEVEATEVSWAAARSVLSQ
jgi:hypothetical protein